MIFLFFLKKKLKITWISDQSSKSISPLKNFIIIVWFENLAPHAIIILINEFKFMKSDYGIVITKSNKYDQYTRFQKLFYLIQVTILYVGWALEFFVSDNNMMP